MGIAPAAPDVLGWFKPLAAGFAIAGIALMAWPGLTEAGLIYAGAGLLVATSIGQGIKGLIVFVIGAVIINAAVVPLATAGPGIDIESPFEGVAIPTVTVD